MSPNQTPTPLGQKLGDFRILSHLGDGGTGAVYRALDEMLDREVAIKMLRPELAQRSDVAERFREEAMTLARLDHPNIARLFGLARFETQLGMVMELVEGETLLARIGRRGRLPWREAIEIAAGVLDGLEAAHRRGIVHRDVKPANVILRADGQVKVTDFGIARVLGQSRRTQFGRIVGTLEYMAPEQIRGEDVDARADVYAMGIVLWEMLGGRAPFSATSEYGLMHQHLDAPAPSIASSGIHAPAWLDELLARAMAKSPADRFASAAEFRRALKTKAEDEPHIPNTRLAVDRPVPPTRVVTDGRRLTRQLNRHRVAAAAAVVTLATSAAFAWPWQPPVTPVVSTVVSTEGWSQPRISDRPMPAPVAPIVSSPRMPSMPAPPPEETAPAPAPTPSPSPAPAPAPAPEPDPAPAAEPEEFEDVVFMMGGEEIDAVLRIDARRIQILDEDAEDTLRVIPFDRVVRATYVQTRQPRRGFSFLKRTMRRLTLTTAEGSWALELDVDNCDAILETLQARLPVSIAR